MFFYACTFLIFFSNIKKIEQCEFSNYFTKCITEALLADPKLDGYYNKSEFKVIHTKTNTC